MTTGKRVTLSPEQVYAGGLIGFMRQAEALRSKLANKLVHKIDHEWETHIQGSLAEMAVAEGLSLPWIGHVNTFKMLPDVVFGRDRKKIEGIEVRYRAKHDLQGYVTRRDDTDDILVVVTGKAPVFYLRGCMPVGDVIKNGITQDDRVFFIAHDQLHDVNNLRVFDHD